MSDTYFPSDDFIERITEVVERNLSNERFGVSELARAIGMSRSNLLRRVKKQTGRSVSQFIRQARLERAMAMLKDPSLTVSEIAFQVGFSSTSYFIKCFREHYGYPPGEAEKRDFDDSAAPLRRHRLAAIMFTDIQGYTALMQHDEEKALEYRNRHREVFNSVTEKFKGKILQYYGDGTLSIFQSAIDAVKCGVELQLAFQSEPSIPVRIGVHSGDIIVSEEDIIGDGVNVASRVESLAAAGSVFISEKVYDEVKNQAGIQTTSLGSFAFKNVDRPMEVFAVANAGLVVPERDQLTGKLKKVPDSARLNAGYEWKKRSIAWLLPLLAIFVAGYLVHTSGVLKRPAPFPHDAEVILPEKSIAVLPFINDSNDSTNVYIINGLMESILNHLQRIEGLRVISRTSVEQYRHTTKVIPEIARELKVRYLVEGSGQKIGDQILLSIQLIEAADDRHLWSAQYNRKTADIFGLQSEVARKIADEIQVFITPAEVQLLEKAPTENLKAYDAYLQGLDLSYRGNREDLQQAIGHYERAIALDPEFAHAYAGLAMVYFFLDYDQTEKRYAAQINEYADKALLYDAQLAESLIAKALFYIYNGAYTSALPHLEKALEYNPNSALAINILADFYTRYVPNTEKYLTYALQGIQLDIAAQDSTTASFTYLHLSNAFIQMGFVEEAERYINRSLDYYPGNLYASYVKAFILYARDGDLAQTRERLLATLAKDTTRLDVMQEVAKICYFMRDYEEAYRYYKKFADIRAAMQLEIYPGENAKIALVMRKMDLEAEADRYIREFREYTANDRSIYHPLNQALLAAWQGDTRQSVQYLEQFAQAEDYHYWILLFLEMDPLMDEVKTLPAFRRIMRTLERKFRNRHERMRAVLAEQQLL